MMSGERLPWFKFYPSDWLTDSALCACSLAAQGAWMRMLCAMHQSQPRGFLQDGKGHPFTDKQIARLIGCAPQTARKIVEELVSLGVVSVTETDGQTTGVLYSRRMVRDDRKLQRDIENGKKGGNAALRKGLTPAITDPCPAGLKLESDTDTEGDTESDSSCARLSNSTSSYSSEVGAAPPPGWEEVEQGLGRLKVSLRRKAIESARGHGFNPPQVLALIAYLESNPHGCSAAHGAIFNRLVHQGADAVDWDADQHWPWSHSKRGKSRTDGSGGPAEDYDKLLAANHPADPKALAVNAIVRDQRDRVAAEGLEERWGATLDQMSDAEITAICAHSKDRSIDEVAREGRSKLATYGRPDPRTRAAMLKVLDVKERKGVA